MLCREDAKGRTGTLMWRKDRVLVDDEGDIESR